MGHEWLRDLPETNYKMSKLNLRMNLRHSEVCRENMLVGKYEAYVSMLEDQLSKMKIGSGAVLFPQSTIRDAEFVPEVGDPNCKVKKPMLNECPICAQWFHCMDIFVLRAAGTPSTLLVLNYIARCHISVLLTIVERFLSLIGLLR